MVKIYGNYYLKNTIQLKVYNYYINFSILFNYLVDPKINFEEKNAKMFE